MSGQVDLDALIAEARGFADWWDASPHNSDLIYGMHRMVDAPGGERVMEKREVSATSLRALADALEQSRAELRQEREQNGKLLDKAGEIAQQNVNLVEVRLTLEAALSRAEEIIEKAKAMFSEDAPINESSWVPDETYRILTEYDKQKGVSDD